MGLRWVEGTVDVPCPVCGHEHAQTLLAMADAHWRDEPVEIVRCTGCGSIVLGAVMPATHYVELDVDRYIEHHASVDSIANLLATTGAGVGSTMLDVGCAYGFGVDLGEKLFGWKAIGLDPSGAAQRGHDDLGVDIRPGTLDDAFDPDATFDVIFSSEVLEHVGEPHEFLAALRRRLSSNGVLMLTTPDASAVRPETPAAVLNAVLSVSAHEFLVDADGLRKMLGDAGLEADIWHVGEGLRALASPSREALATASRDAVVEIGDIIRYCDERATTAPAGSALALGMAVRHLGACVNAERYEEGARAMPRLRRIVRDRYGLDFDDVVHVLPKAEPPGALVDAHYFAGRVALLHDAAPRVALGHFDAAVTVANAIFEEFGVYPHPLTPLIRAHALGYRAVAHAHMKHTRAATRALDDLDQAVAGGIGDAELAAPYHGHVGHILAQRLMRRRARRALGATVRGVQRRLTRGRPSSGHRA